LRHSKATPQKKKGRKPEEGRFPLARSVKNRTGGVLDIRQRTSHFLFNTPAVGWQIPAKQQVLERRIGAFAKGVAWVNFSGLGLAWAIIGLDLKVMRFPPFNQAAID
jgi:hypothetical protein